MNLNAHTVHVWQLDLAALAMKREYCEAALAPEERTRAARYKVAAPRETFVLVRGSLRYLLAGYTGVEPHDVVLASTPTGKPVLTAPYQYLHFNVSHTQGFALIVVARDVHLGVDVERIVPLDDLTSIAQRYFSQVEWGRISALDGKEQLSAFYRVWTRKEAYIKGRGDGLGYPLQDFDVLVGFDPREMSAQTNLLLADRYGAHAIKEWHIQSLKVPPTYTAALAVNSPSALPVMRFTENEVLW